jgi:hypothetical protein
MCTTLQGNTVSLLDQSNTKLLTLAQQHLQNINRTLGMKNYLKGGEGSLYYRTFGPDADNNGVLTS